MATDWKDSARELGSKAATGDQGRALLGEGLNRLHADGYEQLGQISTIVGLRDEVQSGLDSARMYAEKVYADLPPGDQQLDARTQQRVGVALWSIAGALARQHDVGDSGIGYLEGFVEGLQKAASAAGSVVPALASVFPWWVLPVVLAVLFVYVRGFLPRRSA